MAWTLTGDLDEYLASAGGFLRSEPVLHTVELTAAASNGLYPRLGYEPVADRTMLRFTS